MRRDYPWIGRPRRDIGQGKAQRRMSAAWADGTMLVRRETVRRIGVFLALTVAFSAIPFLAIVAGVKAPQPVLAAAAMWSPGLAGLATRLIFERSIAGMGWRLPARKWWIAALGLPLLYTAPVYGFAWLAGAGPDASGWTTRVPFLSAPDHPLEGGPMLALALVLTLGLADKTFRAIGEEIGWRGFLLPELTRVLPASTAAWTSSAIWAVWHLPLILIWVFDGGLGRGLFALACFIVMTMALGRLLAWMRTRSDSVWPCALLHGAHNLLVLSVFDAATRATDWSPILLGQFGAGLIATLAIVVWACLRREPLPD